jgi:predicted MFS family arabinose efflux permease
MLKIGFLISILSFILFSINNNFLISPAIILLSLSLALIDGMKLTYIGKDVTSEFLGTAQGTLNAIYGLSQLFSGILAGLIWIKFGFTFALLIGSLLIFCSLFILTFSFRDNL